MSDTPSVLLITIDALRPDHLGCHGYRRDTSVNIDSLAKEGTLFTQAVSSGTLGVPAMSSILTSASPILHNAITFGDTINPSLPTLAEILKEKGFHTCFIGPHVLSPVKGFNRGFDYFNTGLNNIFKSRLFSGPTPYITILNCLLKFVLRSLPFGLSFLSDLYTGIVNNESAKIVNQKALGWLKKKSDKPFFLWLHYFDTHAPYTCPSPYNKIFMNDGFEQTNHRRLPVIWKRMLGIGGVSKLMSEKNNSDADYYISKYDGAIRFIDYQIGQLMSFLKKNKLYENTLIIITANYGEYLGEHDFYFFHKGVPLEPIVKVPLIIRYAKTVSSEKKVSLQVSSIDIAPTVLNILGISKPAVFEGSSLLPLVLGNPSSYSPYAFMGDRMVTGIRTVDYKFIKINYAAIKELESRLILNLRTNYSLQLEHLFSKDGIPEYLLFDINQDPLESRNIINQNQEKAEEFKRILYQKYKF